MPLPALLPSIITGGASLIGQGINALTGQNANKRNQEWNEKMYNKQFSDSVGMWEMNNQYNSPQEQMKRLQAAGLNPNLVYGNGSAVNTSSAPSTPSAGSYKHQPAQFDLASPAQQAFSTYFDTQIKEAQLSNLKAQNTDITNSAILKSAQTLATLTGEKSTAFKTQFAQDTAHLTRSFMAEQANKMHFEANTADSKNWVQKHTADAQIEAGNLAPANIRQQISNMKAGENKTKAEAMLSAFEVEMQKNGFSKNDQLPYRMLGKLLQSMGIKLF